MSWRDKILVIVSDLGTGEDRLPLERVMRRHIGVFVEFVAQERTWPQIADAMTKAGARHKRGQVIDPKQLRTRYRRIVKKGSHMDERPPPAFSKTDKPDLNLKINEKSEILATVAVPSAETEALPKPRPQTRANNIMTRLAEVRTRRLSIKQDFDE